MEGNNKLLSVSADLGPCSGPSFEPWPKVFPSRGVRRTELRYYINLCALRRVRLLRNVMVLHYVADPPQETGDKDATCSKLVEEMLLCPLLAACCVFDEVAPGQVGLIFHN